MNLSNKPSKSPAGFTIIEQLVAAVFIVLVVIAVSQVFITIGSLNRRANNLTVATQVAQQQIEIFRNTPYSNIAVGTLDFSSSLNPYPTLDSPRSATATVTETTPSNLKLIVITVSYTDRGKSRSVELQTIIGNKGINK